MTLNKPYLTYIKKMKKSEINCCNPQMLSLRRGMFIFLKFFDNLQAQLAISKNSAKVG